MDSDEDKAPRFVCDIHLGRLAAMLRLLGCDVHYRNDLHDQELARISLAEDRVLLTRNRQVLARRSVRRGQLITSEVPLQQAAEVVERFALARRATPWTRCLRCNGLLEPVNAAEVWERLQPRTRLYYREFRRCQGCGQVYWQGSHYQVLQARLRALGVSENESV